MRRAAILVALALMTAPAGADETARKAAREAITRQIEALRRGYPAGAYAEAAPQIRSLFPSPETFLAMVEKGYAAIRRPRSYRFDTAEEAGEDEIAQQVSLQDEAGVDWVALYTLHRQEDGQWRITGCQLRKAPGETI